MLQSQGSVQSTPEPQYGGRDAFRASPLLLLEWVGGRMHGEAFSIADFRLMFRSLSPDSTTSPAPKETSTAPAIVNMVPVLGISGNSRRDVDPKESEERVLSRSLFDGTEVFVCH
jgi:hypothetical protein